MRMKALLRTVDWQVISGQVVVPRSRLPRKRCRAHKGRLFVADNFTRAHVLPLFGVMYYVLYNNKGQGKVPSGIIFVLEHSAN